uniref:C2H2-type domain-containing protein n=1 Tax=Musca domestica TaxID=7370 RepID=A0A1I8MDB4_MUSDO
MNNDHHLNYPVYFFKGYLGYENEEMWDINSSELEMIDIEVDTTDEEDSGISYYEVVQIDEYEISNSSSQVNRISTDNTTIPQIVDFKRSDLMLAAENTRSTNDTSLQHLNLMPMTESAQTAVSTNSRRKKNRMCSNRMIQNNAIIETWSPHLSCPICNCLYTRFVFLEQHFQLAHPGIECHIICCRKKFRQAIDIVNHIFECHENELEPDNSIKIQSKEYEEFVQHYMPIMGCGFCSNVQRGFAKLKEHSKAYHPKEVCSITCCNRKFARLETIAEHILVHLDPQIFRCRICNKSYATKVSLNRHMGRWHRIPKSHLVNVNFLELAKRNKSIARIKFNDLDVFIAASIPELTCIECGCKFSTCGKYIRHFNESHPRKKCKMRCCGFDIHLRHNLEEHLHKHGDTSGFRCIVCHQIFVKRSYLYDHMCWHHPYTINNDVLDGEWIEEINRKNIIIETAFSPAEGKSFLKYEETKAIHHLLVEWGARAYLNGDKSIAEPQIRSQAGILCDLLHINSYRCDRTLFAAFCDAVAEKSQINKPGTVSYTLNYQDILDSSKQRIHPLIYARFKERLRDVDRYRTYTIECKKPSKS